MSAGRRAPRLHRREVVRRLLADRGDLLVVAGLGAPAWDVTAAGDHPLTFPMWGAMGGAALSLLTNIAQGTEVTQSYERSTCCRCSMGLGA